MKRWLRHPLYTAMLAIIWMVLQARLTLGDFLVGYLVGGIVVWVCRDFWTARVTIRRPAVFVALILDFLREVVKANLQVAWIVIRPRPDVRPAFIEIPLDLTDDFTITALANMITLTPGTLTLDISPDRRYLYVHTLNLDDPEGVKEEIRAAFEVYLRELSR